MQIRPLERVLREHPFFWGLGPTYIELIAGCGANIGFNPGDAIIREGEPANHFYVIRRGRVAVEITSPERGPITLETLGEGDVLGWSWLFPPHRWQFDAHALELTRAIALDGACLRDKCEDNPKMGYELMKRFARIMVDRLQAARLQLLDLYSPEHSAR